MHAVDAPSTLLSLVSCAAVARIALLLAHFIGGHTQVNVQRLKETINGREYLIEVSNVGLHKWRAQLRRTPGGSSAMMPFYGSTPDEAAGQLSRWLAIANGQRVR